MNISKLEENSRFLFPQTLRCFSHELSYLLKKLNFNIKNTILIIFSIFLTVFRKNFMKKNQNKLSFFPSRLYFKFVKYFQIHSNPKHFI